MSRYSPVLSRFLPSAILGLALAVPHAALAAQEIVEGELSRIADNYIKVDDDHEYPFDPRRAQCFDFRGDETTCETLVGVGYADKGRLTVVDGVVRRVDIIELQQ